MQRFIKYLAGGVIALSFFFVMPKVTFAQTSVDTGYTDIMRQGIIFAGICTYDPNGVNEEPNYPCPCRDSGDCELSDMLQIFVNISIFILGISGSIVLLVFVYGGFLWITAAGNEKKIDQGKDAMTKAVIGLAIIFGAYAIINFLVASLAGVKPGDTLEGTIEDITNEESGASQIIETPKSTTVE